jgi:hypothetical protein
LISIIVYYSYHKIIMTNQKESRSKNWCFTVNNFTPENETVVRTLGPTCAYLVFGRERGESGTPHLQGFVRFNDRVRFSHVLKSLPAGAHIEVAKKPIQAAEYCEKEGDFESFGDKSLVVQQGKRSDLEIFKAAVRDGLVSRYDLIENHSEVYAKFPRFVREYVDIHTPSVPPELFPLREWQAELYSDLSKPPSLRSVIFVVDIVGNSGKSWFSSYVAHMKDNVQIIQPGRKVDMAYSYDESTRILFLDCPRSKQGEFIQYDFLEQVKDGRLYSSKYESRMKLFTVPHVVVLMNERPDMTKLSSDRYDIRVV